MASNRFGIGLEPGVGRGRLRLGRCPRGIAGRNGRRVLRVALRGVQDVADLDRVRTEVGGGLADVDLRHAPLRAGAGHVGHDLGLELLVDDVALEDVRDTCRASMPLFSNFAW